MINSNQKFMIMVILCVMSVNINLFSCMTTFINDSGNEVRILNKNDEKFIDIPKNKGRRFGSHDQHAHFIIYLQQPKIKTKMFYPEYECQQNECGASGNIILKFSDIQNDTGQTALFTIIKLNSHSSMVDDLPMIKNKNCHSCNAE